MARLWYHGDRKVQNWMHQAQDQLGSEVASEYMETDRSSFIGLATGNAHTHPNYVVLRDLDSYPLPLHLRKDPRAGFHKEAHAALWPMPKTPLLPQRRLPLRRQRRRVFPQSRKRRSALAAMLAGQAASVSVLDPKGDIEPGRRNSSHSGSCHASQPRGGRRHGRDGVDGA